MLKHRYVVLAMALVIIGGLSLYSSGQTSSQTPDQKAIQEVKHELSPEDKQTFSEVLLSSNFISQINYYRRVPSSYEEWRDSGLFVWTLWSGDPTRPAAHVDHALSLAVDPVGTFHYESLGPAKYRLEFIQNIENQKRIYSAVKDRTAEIATIKRVRSYEETKADLYYTLMDFLHINYYNYAEPPRGPDDNPGSIFDVINGYVSLVPEGFKLPAGTSFNNFFEYGFDFQSGKTYALTDIPESLYSLMIDDFNAPLGYQESRIEGHPKLTMFSSNLLEQGYPDIFD
jgi:hypothetical protein